MMDKNDTTADSLILIDWDMTRVGTNFWLKMGELRELFSGKLIPNFKKTI